MRTQLEQTVAQSVANRCILAERIKCTYNLRWSSSIQWSSWNNYNEKHPAFDWSIKIRNIYVWFPIIYLRSMTRVFMTWMHTFVDAVICCKPTGDCTQNQNWIKCRMGCLLLQHFRHMWCLCPPWHSCRPSLLSTRFRCLQRIQWRRVPGDRAVQWKLQWGPMILWCMVGMMWREVLATFGSSSNCGRLLAKATISTIMMNAWVAKSTLVNRPLYRLDIYIYIS